MTWTDGVTLAVGLLAALVALLGNRTQRRIAQQAAERKRQDDLTAEQEAVTTEQVKAEDAKEERFSRDLWRFIDELKSDRTAQDERIKALEAQVSDLRADLEQVRHVEREHRRKVERLTAENTTLRAEVERLKAENAALHARIQGVEARQNSGDAPTGPGPAGAPPAIA